MQFIDRLCEILGYPRAELAAKTWAEITHPDDLAAEIAQFNRVLAGKIDGYTLDKRFIRRDGQTMHTVISVRCVHSLNGAPDYLVVIVQDITERKALELELRRLATTDPLTDLANRRHFLAQIELELELLQRYAKPAALLMIDLDHFKQVNDLRGHLAGDQLLAMVGAVIRDQTRTVDTAAVRECNGMLIINPIADIKTWEELKVVSVKGLLQGDRVSIGISNFSPQSCLDTDFLKLPA